jgi:MoaA/NifB/PqqE/SkfB family radical SAM enzyme
VKTTEVDVATAPVPSSISSIDAAFPEVLYVELADYCNLNCVFCGRENEIKTLRGGDAGGFADLDKIKMLERPLRAAKYLGLSGRIGEPLIYPHLAELLQWVYSINSQIELRITTNGTALSRKMADLLRDHIDFLAISLNAASADAYARDMRPVGYRKGMDWTPKWANLIRRITDFIEALPPRDRARVRVIAPVHRDNADDIRDFVKLVASMGCTHAILTPMQVHDEPNIELSVYWFKDKYNDLIDEVAAWAAQRGVRVEAARFYATVKTDLAIDMLCHEPSTSAYLNMGTQWKGAPCCQWTERFIPMDVYSDLGAFERFWNSDLYRRLRANRDFASCKACGLTRTFDEVMFHFTPLLKSKLIASKRIEEAEEQSLYPDHGLVAACRSLTLDLPSLRRAVKRFGVPVERLHSIEIFGLRALPALDRACWEAFLADDSPPEDMVDLRLGGCFTGIGWFHADNDPSTRVAARWMGGGRIASVFVRVVPGGCYNLRLMAHHADSMEKVNGLSIKVCGQPLEIEKIVQDAGIVTLSCLLPSDITTSYGGRLWITVGYDDSHHQSGWISFSQLAVETWLGAHDRECNGIVGWQ